MADNLQVTIVYSDLCCFLVFSLNYCFAAVVLIATNKVEYINPAVGPSLHSVRPAVTFPASERHCPWPVTMYTVR